MHSICASQHRQSLYGTDDCRRWRLRFGRRASPTPAELPLTPEHSRIKKYRVLLPKHQPKTTHLGVHSEQLIAKHVDNVKSQPIWWHCHDVPSIQQSSATNATATNILRRMSTPTKAMRTRPCPLRRRPCTCSTPSTAALPYGPTSGTYPC
jgi:hypothetical protein